MILVTASGKGGVGKTTTAALLYAAAERAGIRAQLVNVDPQRSLVNWLGDELVLHRPDISQPHQLTSLDLPELLLIVDTPAGTAPQAIAACAAADILIGCTGPTTMDVEGLVDLGSRVGEWSEIDLVAVGRFDSRANLSHGVLNLLRKRWGAAKIVIFPNRTEAARAYDERRTVQPSSPVAVAADDLLARALDLPAAAKLRKEVSHA